MSRLHVWLSMGFGSLLYYFHNGDLKQFSAAIYFSAIALLVHWVMELWSKKSSNTGGS